MDCILSFLKTLNDDYSQLLLFAVALFSLILVYTEFISKRRPYIFPEIVFEENAGNWNFNFILNNTGAFPAQVKVNKAQLNIGDEVYPTQFQTEMVIPPGEIKKILPIGHINQIGRNKIIGNQYSKNRVEIIFEISAKSIGDKSYKFQTAVMYTIDVTGSKPIIQLISENFS